MRVALSRATLATAVRMVDRVHRGTANGRTHAAPARRTGLAELLEVVLRVADLANRRAALGRDLAHFAGAKTQRRVAAFARDELRGGAGRTRELRALARLHLDAVHRRPDRDVAKRQRIARLDRRIAARHQLIADLRALGRDDVAALAVDVAQERNVRRAV